MSTYVLIHGAANSGWFWHLVSAELRARGHEVLAPDLPCDDDSAELVDYVDTVVDAIGDRRELVVVAHSLGGFTAPLVCDRVPVDLLVLVAGMIPQPGEAPGDWWANTSYQKAWRERCERDGTPPDATALHMHDLPPALAATALTHVRDQSGAPMAKPWPLPSWPDVPTRLLVCRDDRFFPIDFMRRVAHDRLGVWPDEMDGSHSVALSRPVELTDRLESYRSSVSRAARR
jgi:pimeloyl-ACP methyl ester carboxylesterase